MTVIPVTKLTHCPTPHPFHLAICHRQPEATKVKPKSFMLYPSALWISSLATLQMQDAPLRKLLGVVKAAFSPATRDSSPVGRFQSTFLQVGLEAVFAGEGWSSTAQT